MARTDSTRWRVEPGTKVHLGKVDTRSTDGAPGDKTETESGLEGVLAEMHRLQERLYAEGEQSLLVVLQAIDAGGKDGTIKHVFRGAEPAGRAGWRRSRRRRGGARHDFLWRVHAKAPGARARSASSTARHYEDVLVVRVHELVPEAVWRPATTHQRTSRRRWSTAGTTIVKLYLHISKDEQAERFQARLDDPTKQWKFRRRDLAERERWDDYQAAFEEAIAETSTDDGAVVRRSPPTASGTATGPSLRILIETLEEMDPQYPPEEDLTGVVIT